MKKYKKRKLTLDLIEKRLNELIKQELRRELSKQEEQELEFLIKERKFKL